MNIGVIIIHYGKNEITNDCISSVLMSQFRSKEFQTFIYVLDNDSPEKFDSNKWKNAPNVITITSNSNLGFSGGINCSLKEIQKNKSITHVLLLNNDAKLNVNSLQELIDAELTYGAGLFAPILTNESGFPIELGGKINEFSMFQTGFPYYTNRAFRVEFITGACIFTSIKTLNTIGIWDERFFMYCEDVDYCIRANLLNIPVYIIPNARVIHLVGQASGTLSRLAIYYIHRNRIYLARKYQNIFQYFFFSIYYSVVILLKLVKWTIRKPSLVQWFLLGCIDGFFHRTGKTNRNLN